MEQDVDAAASVGPVAPARHNAPGKSLEANSALTAERLRFEEEQSYYNELYLLAPVGYFLVAFDSAILQANLAGAELLGIERAHSNRHHFRSFIRTSYLPDTDSHRQRLVLPRLAP